MGENKINCTVRGCFLIEPTSILQNKMEQLTDKQKVIVNLLKEQEVSTGSYPFSDWYRGALRVLADEHNPDRFSQASNSLREIMEKLFKMDKKKPQQNTQKLQSLREKFLKQICESKKQIAEDGIWIGKEINNMLSDALCMVEEYVEEEKLLTRTRSVAQGYIEKDYLYSSISTNLVNSEITIIKSICKKMQNITHHQVKNNDAIEKDVEQLLNVFEELVYKQFAPITAENREEIDQLLQKESIDNSDVEQIIKYISHNGANHQHFFHNVDKSIWLQPLNDKIKFEDEESEGAIAQFLIYFEKIADVEPKQITDIILKLNIQKHQENLLRLVCKVVLKISKVDIELSLEYKKYVEEYIKFDERMHVFGDLETTINMWGNATEESIKIVEELLIHVIAFQSDPETQNKINSSKSAKNVRLSPLPRFKTWEYEQIMLKCMNKFCEMHPRKAVDILLKATNEMIHEMEYCKNDDLRVDISEVWCESLTNTDAYSKNVYTILVHALRYACEQLYEKKQDEITWLDTELRRYKWDIFTRLRLFLYSKYPNDINAPWISAHILEYPDYAEYVYGYELQVCIRSACEYFKKDLLTESQINSICERIKFGPPKDIYAEMVGIGEAEKHFEKYRKNFHLKQLNPFKEILSEKYMKYLNELIPEFTEELNDDSYSRFGKIESGIVVEKSPEPFESLKSKSDYNLLLFINSWEPMPDEKQDLFIRISHEGLSANFVKLFEEVIIQDKTRLIWWLEHRTDIKKAYYVQMIIKAMTGIVKKKDFGQLEVFFEFINWALGADRVFENLTSRYGFEYTVTNVKQSVLHFIEECFSSVIPAEYRTQIYNIMSFLCLESVDDIKDGACYDRMLDVAINTQRGYALYLLIQSVSWLRKVSSEDYDEITKILDDVISSSNPLKEYEQVLLISCFTNLCLIDKIWVTSNISLLLPREDRQLWYQCIKALVVYNIPYKDFYATIKDELEYVVDNMQYILGLPNADENTIKRIGYYCVEYYLDGFYLISENSILDKYYQAINGNPKICADVFRYIGRLFSGTEKLYDNVITKVMEYVSWRYDVGNQEEILEFTWWLDLKCFHGEWRLRTFSKILDMQNLKNNGINYQTVDVLIELQEEYPLLVIECFKKISSNIDIMHRFMLEPKKYNTIIHKGLQSDDKIVKSYAEKARDNLMRKGVVVH